MVKIKKETKIGGLENLRALQGKGVNLADSEAIEEALGEMPDSGFVKTVSNKPKNSDFGGERPNQKRGQKRTQIRTGETEERTEEVVTMEKQRVNQPSRERQPGQGTGMQEGRTFTLRAIYPRIQAVVDELMNEIPALPNDIKWRHNRSKGERQTVFTFYNRDNNVTIPEKTITPNSWKLSLAVEKREGEAIGVVYLSEGRAKSVRPFILRRQGKPEMLIYGFCSTKGRTSRAYIIQVNKGREVLVVEWSLSADAQWTKEQKPSIVHSAQRRREQEPSVEERIPGLDDLERTRNTLPALLAPMAETICFLFDRACGKPMPQREETAEAKAVAAAEAVTAEAKPKAEPEAEAAPAEVEAPAAEAEAVAEAAPAEKAATKPKKKVVPRKSTKAATAKK